MATRKSKSDRDSGSSSRIRKSKLSKARVDDEYGDESSKWRKERRQLNDEIDRLDHELQKAKSELRRARTEDDSGDAELQAQLKELTTLKEEADAKLETEKEKWSEERTALKSKVTTLEERLVDALERSSNPARTQAPSQVSTKQLAKLERTVKDLEQELEQARSEAAAELEEAQKGFEEEKAKLVLQLDRFKKAAKKRTTPTATQTTTTEPKKRRSLRDKLFAKGDDSEDQELQAALVELRGQLEAAEDTRDELMTRVDELESVASDARKAAKEYEAERKKWEKERTALQTEIEELKQETAASTSEASDSQARITAELKTVRSELSETREKLSTTTERLETAEADLAEATREVANLKAKLADAGKNKKLESRIADLEEQLETQASDRAKEQEEYEEEIERLNQELSEASSKADVEELEAVRDEMLSKVRDAEGQRRAIEKKYNEAEAAWAQERKELEATIQASRHGESARTEQIESELREKMILEYEEKIKKLTAEKDELEDKIRTSESKPVAAAAGAPVAVAGDSALADEIARVDAQIAEIVAFIDDPDSALSSVVKKNVERSELEAYRRGLAYLLEGGKSG